MTNHLLHLAVMAVFFAFIYASLFHDAVKGFYYRNNKFNCLRCGQCCRLKVRLSPEDIRRIRKAGYQGFVVNKNFMKQANGYCVFLKINNGKAACKIQNIKPGVCRSFPRTTWLGVPVVDTKCMFYKRK